MQKYVKLLCCRVLQLVHFVNVFQLELTTKEKEIEEKLREDPIIKNKLLQLLNLQLGYSKRGIDYELTRCDLKEIDSPFSPLVPRSQNVTPLALE